MSHYHERKEKVCLNCGTVVHGRFCHKCGQENIEPKETMWGLVTHFVYDITHFDGKFFSTAKYLIVRPGFLSKEYIRGRRARYLHPIRMYVFSSAFFFIIFFSMFDRNLNPESLRNTIDSGAVVADAREDLSREARDRRDSVRLGNAIDRIRRIPAAGNQERGDSGRAGSQMISFFDTPYRSKVSYDSAQNTLVPARRDSWIRTRIMHKQFDINAEAEKDPGGFFAKWLNFFMHSFPQLLFVSLPLFALLLHLLYIRHKQYYYADHAIFSIHLYVFTFVALLISFLLSELSDTFSWRIFSFLNMILAIYLVLYTYKGMRKFYGQGRLKTFVKYVLLTVSSSIVILFLFVVFLLLSVLKF